MLDIIVLQRGGHFVGRALEGPLQEYGWYVAVPIIIILGLIITWHVRNAVRWFRKWNLERKNKSNNTTSEEGLTG